MMKKFVLFIVEGRNDEREINAILHTPFFKGFLENCVPQFKPLGRDITLDAPGKASIRKAVEKEIRSWKKGDVAPFQPIKNAYIKEVVHIVDMDGAGVTEENIIQDHVGGFVYEDECIRVAKLAQAVQRNAIKRKNLKELSEIDQIDNIPYRIFYVSCNMDHLLANQQNAETAYKTQFSFDYANICKKMPDVIFKSVLSDEYGTQLSYEESWNEIWEGTNSLKRRTNLNILLREYGEF